MAPGETERHVSPAHPPPSHPHESELTWEELLEALAALEGSRVAVRVVERTEPETLVAVFRGRLEPATYDKHPTVFWPVRAPREEEPGDMEKSGIYLQRDRFHGAAGRAGGHDTGDRPGPGAHQRPLLLARRNTRSYLSSRQVSRRRSSGWHQWPYPVSSGSCLRGR